MSGHGTTLETNPWRSFWNRGRWWKAVLAAAVYLLLYELAGLGVGAIAGADVSADLLADPLSVLLSLVLPLLVGAVLLTLFVASVGWFPALFGRQPIAGRWWMWLAVAVTAIPITLRLIGTDYGAYAAGVVPLTFVAGLLVGLTEEVLTRGIVVKILRDAGHRERTVAVVSSAIFALLHSVNAFSGQPILTVVLTVAFAFGFGLMMYLVLRVTGSLVWPILIHALTDPTTILAVGGIDAGTAGADNPFLVLAGPFNMLFVVFGVVAIVFIRGRRGPAPTA